MSNVINFMDYYQKSRRDQQKVENEKPQNKKEKAPVLDITETRKAMLQDERRVVKRTILTEFIGAFAILPERGLIRVNLFDISDRGLAFDIPAAEGQYQKGEEVAMRIYLNHKTYFPFVAKITYSRSMDEEGLLRHGANFVDGTINDVALHHFIQFIENISASLKTDNGDIQVSQIS